MTAIQIIALLIVVAGAFGTINYFFLRLPPTMGILAVALAASLAVMIADAILPPVDIAADLRAILDRIGFAEALMDWMLGLLLFAGAMHVKIDHLRSEAWSIALMVTLGVALSTLVAGVGFAWATGMPLLVALVFGALISPTDPVAVLGVLRDANLRKSLEIKISGESLLNDGAAYAAFLLLVGLAFSEGDAATGGWPGVVLLFVREAGGGLLLGMALGWLVLQVMRRIDEYRLEVLLTLGLALGGYEIAAALGVSGPITAVVAGLFVGDIRARHGVAAVSKDYLDKFWEIVDELLNAVLFMLIGAEILDITFDLDTVTAGLLAIALSLIARLVSVAVPVAILQPFRAQPRDVIPIMTWGGLKGGVSVALALSLPDSEWKPTILTATYMVVVFSILVQGLTVGRLARRFGTT